MNNSGLSFTALPPIDLPARFFISAPLFMISCAFLVLFSGESLWLTRWHPSMLALTHGITLGFITMVMMGALLQLLPVIVGIGIVQPRLITSVSHLFYTLGVFSLMLAFFFGYQWLTMAAILLLILGLIPYLAAVIWVLMKKLSKGDSITGFRLAVLSLLILFVLGLVLLSTKLGYTADILIINKHVTDVHAFFGLAGWTGLLIMAVSFQVIPMFHVAPDFPKAISRYLSVLIFCLLILFVVTPELAMQLVFISYGAFALALLYVIHNRKRKVADVSIRYWQLAALSLLVLNFLYFLPSSIYYGEGLIEHNVKPNKTILLTAIFIYFFLVSVIQGMLLKILPFLSCTHLQQRCLFDFSAMQYIPHMHDFLVKKHAAWLYYFHVLTGTSLIFVLFQPSFYYLFALLLLLEFSWLLFLMIKCLRLYFKTDKKITLFSSN